MPGSSTTWSSRSTSPNSSPSWTSSPPLRTPVERAVPPSFEGEIGEIVEVGPGVRLRPEADAPGLEEGPVPDFEIFLVVERADDPAVDHRHAERVPLVVTRDVGRSELGPLPGLDLVDAEIALQRIIPGD